MNVFFVPSHHSYVYYRPEHLDFKENYFSRSLLLMVTAFLVVLLHGAGFVWYFNRPLPQVYTQAVAMPMIDIALQLPAASQQKIETLPALTQPPTAQSQPIEKPIEKKIAPKPMIKKPKTPALVKKVAVKEVAQSLPSPPPATQTNMPSIATRASSPQVSSQPPQPVVEAHADANYLNNPKPIYPRIAQLRHWQGTVILRVHVTPDGHSSEVIVYRSSGHDELDDAAVEAVEKWRFVPGRQGDTSIATWVNIPIEFELLQ